MARHYTVYWKADIVEAENANEALKVASKLPKEPGGIDIGDEVESK